MVAAARHITPAAMHPMAFPGMPGEAVTMTAAPVLALARQAEQRTLERTA